MWEKGFTLIEMMIVVAIVGILSTTAYPGYTEYVKRAHRAEIAGLLSETAQQLERFYSRNGQYSDVAGPPAVKFEIPAGNRLYTVTAERADVAMFRLIATPVPTAMMNGDKCGGFVIDNRGKRDNVDLAEGVTPQRCWGR